MLFYTGLDYIFFLSDFCKWDVLWIIWEYAVIQIDAISNKDVCFLLQTPIEDIKPADQKNSLLQKLLSE